MTDSVRSATPSAKGSNSYAWRICGLLLLLLVAVPFYRLAGGSGSDRIAADVIDAADVARTLLLLGSFIVLVVGLLASKMFDAATIDGRIKDAGAWLASIPIAWYAASLAIVAALLCLGFSLFTLQGKPNLIDAMVQLTQARYLAAGRLGGPLDSLSEFWQLPNSMNTPAGWVSQYPPGHIALLALGMVLRAPVIVGPILVGITVFFTALTAERLFLEERPVARVGVLMLALSPFLLGLAGAFMNHVAAAAFISVGIYCAVRRAEGEGIVWAAIAGAAVGAVFTVRPLTAVVAALIVAMTWIIWDPRPFRDKLQRLLTNAAAAVVGVAPFLLVVAAYNKHFFGNPLRFGYTAVVGPLVSPGFHRDPGGHVYGPLQALAYTSSDLTILSMYLLESAIPACLVAALFLMLVPRLSRGAKIVAVWALLPLVGNALYWHHGFFMGPRMLNEWAPAWALLTAVAAVGLVRAIPSNAQFRGYSFGTGLSIAFLLAWVAGVFYLGPQRLARYGGSYLASARMTVPLTKAPALIFVHGGWSTRIAMRLTAHGMRGDSLEAALALNPTCDVQSFANWYASANRDKSAAPAQLNFDFSAGPAPQRMKIAQGDEIRYYKGRPLPPQCLSQVASDTLGIIDIAPLAWQGDLPGLGGNGAMIVRDMGPAENSKLITRYADRVPMMLLRTEKEGVPTLVPYDVGIRTLWPNG